MSVKLGGSYFLLTRRSCARSNPVLYYLPLQMAASPHRLVRFSSINSFYLKEFFHLFSNPFIYLLLPQIPWNVLTQVSRNRSRRCQSLGLIYRDQCHFTSPLPHAFSVSFIWSSFLVSDNSILFLHEQHPFRGAYSHPSPPPRPFLINYHHPPSQVPTTIISSYLPPVCPLPTNLQTHLRFPSRYSFPSYHLFSSFCDSLSSKGCSTLNTAASYHQE